MPYCRSCGAQIAEEDRFCRSCGAEQNLERAPENKPQKSVERPIPSHQMQYMQILKKYYEKLDTLIREECDLNDDLDLSFELFPFLIVTGSCSFLELPSDALKDEANKFNDEIMNPILNAVSGNERELADRIALYASIVQGDQLRGEWCMGFIPPHLSLDPVMRCVIVLGDIILNPECSGDYFSNLDSKTTMKTMKVFSTFAEKIPNIMNEYRSELQEKASYSPPKKTIADRLSDIGDRLLDIVLGIVGWILEMRGILLLLGCGIALIIVMLQEATWL